MPETISLLTLNIRFGLADDGDNAWRWRKDAFAPLFDRYRSDFMAFQEVNDFQADDLGRLLPGYSRVGQRVPAPPFWQNNLIFYRHPWRCIHSDHFFLSPTPKIPSRFRGSRWPRQCTLAVFEKGQRRVVCINTHFDFKETVQADSARVVLARLSEIGPGLPALLAGDFNASPGTPCHRLFTDSSGTGAAAGFRNAFAPPFPATHHGFSGARIGDHIDWILYRGGLRLLSSRVIEETFSGRYPSDHFPLTAVFAWTAPES